MQALLFLEELTSILLTPFVLWWSLPQSAPAIVAFVRDHTVRVPGVGDVCSLAAFSLPMHGNPKYGSPFKAAKVGPRSPHFPSASSVALFGMTRHSCLARCQQPAISMLGEVLCQLCLSNAGAAAR